MDNFVKWMIAERKSRKWNQSRVADKVGVHVNTMIRWENGQAFTLDQAQRIANIYGAEIVLKCKDRLIMIE